VANSIASSSLKRSGRATKGIRWVMPPFIQINARVGKKAANSAFEAPFGRGARRTRSG
jgi:hypothetical protein